MFLDYFTAATLSLWTWEKFYAQTATFSAKWEKCVTLQ